MSPTPPPTSGGSPIPTAETFRDDFGEELAAVLNLDTWQTGRNLDAEYRRIEAEVQWAVEYETEQQRNVRHRIHHLLSTAPQAPPGAGRHRVEPEEILDVHRDLLFNGAVEACDGISQIHDTLALTIHQISVCAVSYRGETDCLQQRLFRRDLRMQGADPIEAVLDLLEKRNRRGGSELSERDVLSELAQRGLLSYAERAVLATRARAPWRMGHGSPAPLELIVATFPDLAIESIRAIRRLVEQGRFVFVHDHLGDRALLTIGQSLHPLEYAIVGTLKDRIERHLDSWAAYSAPTVDCSWDGVVLPAHEWVRRFRDLIAPQVVYGVYRATLLGPPQVFYAHVQHADIAARIALADSVLLEQRGFPLLLDLASRICRSIYAGGSLQQLAAAAYLSAGALGRLGGFVNGRVPEGE